MDEIIENIPQEHNKIKRILKIWLIVLWISFISLGFILNKGWWMLFISNKGWNNWINVIIYFIIWILEAVLYVLLITNTFTANKRFKWLGIFLLSIFSVILVHFIFWAINWVFAGEFTWFDVFCNLSLAILNCILILIKIKKNKDNNKKNLKIVLILYFGLFIVATRLQSTTLWFIPDWLWIKSVYNPGEVVCERGRYGSHYECCNWYGNCYGYRDYPKNDYEYNLIRFETKEE